MVGKTQDEMGMSELQLALFPVHGTEMVKFTLMSAMMFFTIFVFALLRTIKDPMVAGGTGSSMEVISFLKAYLVTPAAIVVSILYMRLRKSVDLQRSYNIIVGIFLVFFVLYGFYLKPNQAVFTPSDATILGLQKTMPMLKWFFVIYQRWMDAVFYVFAELWGTLMLSVLFWQFANDNINTRQSMRFYPLFIMLSNVALILVGKFVKHYVTASVDDKINIDIAMIAITVCGILLAVVFYVLNQYVLPVEVSATADGEVVSKKPKKKKLSFMESLGVLAKSEYVLYIALIVLAYGATINLFEQTWKSQVKLMFPTEKAMANFYADYMEYAGYATIVMNFLSKGVIRRLGWLVGALVTPIACGVCGSLFYIFMLSQDSIMQLLQFDQASLSAMTMAVYFGGFGVLMSKSAKYCFFDPTKEQVYIPLDMDLRTNGKAAADGVCGRLGKSAGAWIISSLIMVTGSTLQDLSAPLAVLVIILSVFWLFSVVRLQGLYSQQLRLREQEASLASEGVLA